VPWRRFSRPRRRAPGGRGEGDGSGQVFPSFGVDMSKWASFEIGSRFIDTNYER